VTASNPVKLSYSLRRAYVDDFHDRHIPTLAPGSRVLDLGGLRLAKRGRFDIEQRALRVVVANLSRERSPHVQADAARTPFADGCFDAVICSELLEHVPEPGRVLSEAGRVLRPGGVLLVCVPFLFHVHADPYDYGRYTDYYWREALARAGFGPVQVEKQGLFWSVLADMLRAWVYHRSLNVSLPGWQRRPLAAGVRWLRRRAVAWDAQAGPEHPFYGSYTTGYGLVAVKASGA